MSIWQKPVIRGDLLPMNQVIIVTGASQGLGAAVASHLAAGDAAVCLVARSGTALSAIEARILDTGGRAMAIPADVADPEACRQIVAKSLERWGRVDALVNNAGILGPLAYTADADPWTWLHTLKVNVVGPYQLARAAIPLLRQWSGRIVNVSSGAAVTALAGAGAYCVSKAALNHFTRILAAEEPGITSVAVRPGVVDTPMQTTLRENAPLVMPKDLADYYQKIKKEGGLEPPDVPGKSIAWLALNAPPEWSGRFLDYDDPEIAILR
jgi:NAD(P)-dependent dehydrogenase (short-subunit alcohol dehydrogenase family)